MLLPRDNIIIVAVVADAVGTAVDDIAAVAVLLAGDISGIVYMRSVSTQRQL